MKNIYFKSKINNLSCRTFLQAFLLLGIVLSSNAQLRVPFTQRTSQYTPTKTIYNIKGDFTMIGNTNLTLQNYGNNTNNNDNSMVYVDVDGVASTFNSSSSTLALSTENGANPACSNIIYAGLYWTGKAAQDGAASPDTFNVTKVINGTSVTKTFNKRVISLKGPTASSYTQFTAATNDIYYPNTDDATIYSAYTEVTDYVRQYGVGSYTAADIAIRDGVGNSTGFSGGWGMIVVYENSKMKYRDVTIFDGHAFVLSSNTGGFNLPVSGFNAVQFGNVGVKMGLMASEGDVNLTGDYFRIRNLNTANYTTLSHSGNSPTNFFNSSINTGGNPRNPTIQNNTGVDISMFSVPNSNNSVIGNNQTSTNFQYGTSGDTYAIFAIAIAVDAYIPDVDGSISTVSINGVPAGSGPYTALPGQEIAYKIQVKNRGTEAVNNFKVTVPVPYNATFVSGSISKNVYFTPLPTPNTATYSPTIGANGSIVWDFGTLPLPANPDVLLADITFKFKVTEDCTLLANSTCANIIAVNGTLSGMGAITNIRLPNRDLIQGYSGSGSCQGTAIPAPLLVNINATSFVNANCQNTPTITPFTVCNVTTSIPITTVSGAFPPGSTFYNQYPVVGTTTQYTINNPFPATVGTSTYYAVPPGVSSGCYFPFTITVTNITSQPTVSNVQYCVGATASPLTATPSTQGFMLFYYTSQTATAQMSITPSTATVGQTTYYVAEGQSSTCIGPKIPIVVTVYAIPTVPTIATPVQPTCALATGSILLSALPSGNWTITQSGTAAATYTGTSASFNVTGLAAGSYTFTVTTNNCASASTATLTINAQPVTPPAPTVGVTVTQPTCTNPNGSFTIANYNGGNVYTVTPSAGVTISATGVVTAPAGTYTITASANGCTSGASATVTINAQPVTPPAPTVGVTVTQPTCTNANGSFTIANYNGGNVYTVTPSAGVTISATGVVTAPAGTYTITASANGCTSGASATVTINAQPVTPPAPTVGVTVTQPTCTNANGSFTIANYNGGNVYTVTPSAGVTISATGVVTAPAGTYTITASANGCTSGASATVTINAQPVTPPAPTVGVTVTQPTCTNANGSFTIANYNGGNVYTVTPSAGVTISATGVVTAPAGPYTITASANGCTSGASATVTINAQPVTPPAPTVGVTVTQPTCTNANGSFTIANYNGGNVYTVTPSAGVTISATGVVTAPAGTYTITASANGCTSGASATVTINAQPVTPPAPTVGVTVTQPTCTNANGSFTIANYNGGNVYTVTPSAGVTISATGVVTAPAGTYTITASANGCTSGASATVTINAQPVTPPAPTVGVTVTQPTCTNANGSFTIANYNGGNVYTVTPSAGVTISATGVVTAPAGPYTITASANGCTSGASATVTINAQPVTPPAPTVGVTVTQPTCTNANGSFTIANYNGGNVYTVTPSAGVTISATGVVTAPAGTYTITASANGCTSGASATVTINAQPVTPPAPTVSVTVTQPTCTNANGSFTIANYNGGNVYTVTPSAGVTISATGVVTAPAGTYTITASANGCTSGASATVTINAQPVTPPAPTVGVTVTQPTCTNANGSFTIANYNGGNVYTVTPSAGVTISATGVVTAPAGTYTITASANGCTSGASATVTINAQPVTPPAPTVGVTVTQPTCTNANGSFTIANYNGGNVYTVTPSAGVTISATGVVTAPAGTYTITASANGCTSGASATVTINAQPVTPPAPTIGVTVTQPTCTNANGSFTIANYNGGNVYTVTPSAGVTISATGVVTAPAGTYTITASANGCTSGASATVTINPQPTIPPIISGLTSPPTTTISCPAAPVFDNPTGSDSCGNTLTLTFVDQTTPACPGTYTIIRTWTAIDATGLITTASQTIIVQDITAPVWVTQAGALDQTVECSDAAGLAAAQALFPVATDTCDPDVTDIVKVSGAFVASAGCPNAGTYTNTWTVTDACGNVSAVYTQIITIQDTTAPTITTDASNITVECDGQGNQTAINNWLANNGGATASDNCSEVTWTNDFNALSSDCSAAVTVTFTATDACGNTSTSSGTFSVQDITPPVAPQAPEAVNVTCDTLVPPAQQLTAQDNCAGTITATGVDSTSVGSCPNSFVITRTWTFTDACSNSSSVSQIITVNDTIAPVIDALPEPTTISCPATPAFAQAVATDNCGTTVTLTSVDATVQGACAGSYSVTRTWTATDPCGNTTTATQTINVEDTTAPSIAQLPAATTIYCPATPEFDVATATDECGSDFTLTSVDANTPGACAGSYSVTRTWTATDACGNVSTASQTINVEDTTAPVIAQLPVNSTISCPATPEFAVATATDECGSDFTLTSVDSTNPGTCAGSYSVTRTWTATDACGNVSTATQTIDVLDTTAPVIAELPAASIIDCPATPEFAEATATDACGSAFTLTFNDVNTPGACTGSYSVTRTWTATDACANVSTATQTITVRDITPPTITTEASNIVVECDGTGNTTAINDWLAANGGAAATDACSDVIWTNDFIALGNDCSAAVTVIFTATDACGNASTTSATFTVQDITAPVAPEAPAATTVACASLVPVSEPLSAQDNCAGIITAPGIDSIVEGSCPNSYVITRTWTFTDACSNTTFITQTITVNDTVAPVIDALPGATTISCPATPVFAEATATDNCGTTFTLVSADVTTPGACAGSYSVTRTWTATDVCGNVSTATQTINVEDTTAPVIAELPAASTISCPATPEFAVATAVDACGSEFTLTSVDATTPGACAGSYSVTRTWTATDTCGNIATATQTINVEDTTAPVIAELPVASTISCPATPEFAVATAVDACGSEFTLTSADVTTPGACAGSYSVTRTWTATDACGNVSTATQTINVGDTTAPVIAQLPAATTISCPATPEFAVATATDACGSAFTLTSADVTTAGTCAGSYSVTRTWTATDSCGNVSTATQTINVEDTAAPVISQLPAETTISCGITPVFAVATAIDACGSDFTLTSNDVTTQGNCAGSYSVTRTWTATDVCGNVSTATQTINVQDTTAPVIDTLPVDSVIECPATPVFANATATDACGSAVTLTFVDVNTPGNNSSYTIVRTWTATDACGNASTATQSISVMDTQAPVVPVLADVVAQCSVTVTPPVGQDLCAGPITATQSTFPTLVFDQQGTFTIQWVFSDGNGNSFTANQTVIVHDTAAPIAPVLADISGPCHVTVPVPTTTDGCTLGGIQGTTNDLLDYDTVGTHVVTWTFTDAAGNSVTATQNAIVTGPDAPIDARSTAADCNNDITKTFNLNDILVQENVVVAQGGTWSTTDPAVITHLTGSTFAPYQVPVGDHIFTYTVQTAGCPQVVNLTMVVDDNCPVEPAGTCEADPKNAFSPNGDGINEFFYIANLDDSQCFIENTVEIYNRWGVLVFDTNHYDNNNNVFTGKSEGRVTVDKGSELPTGTYFYIIKFTRPDGRKGEKDGYLYLTR